MGIASRSQFIKKKNQKPFKFKLRGFFGKLYLKSKPIIKILCSIFSKINQQKN